MKKYLIALSAFTVMAVAANAQTSADSSSQKSSMHMHHKDGYGMHKSHHGDMMKDLNLTDAQKQQMKTLHSDYKNQLNALEKNDNISLKDYHAKKAAIEQERKSKFESILTPDQKNKIAMAKKDRSEKMKLMSQKRLDKMKTDLNLTDAQVSKMQKQHDNFMAHAKVIKENTSLTEEQKKEQFMDLRKSSKESMKSILTADQLKKQEELRNSRISEWKNKKANKES